MGNVIFVGKRFTLGVCRCGCQQSIGLKMSNCKLQKFKKGHHAFGSNNSDWKGGKRTHVEGYIEIYSPNHPNRDARNIVREHRLVWEREHNAMLLDWAIVHHKDHDVKNNVWYNLQAMMNYQHSQLHKKDLSERFCLICGITQKHKWFRYGDGWICQRHYDKRKAILKLCKFEPAPALGVRS